MTEMQELLERIDALERRVAALERMTVSRDALDEEIRSVEHRMTELREHDVG